MTPAEEVAALRRELDRTQAALTAARRQVDVLWDVAQAEGRGYRACAEVWRSRASDLRKQFPDEFPSRMAAIVWQACARELDEVLAERDGFFGRLCRAMGRRP